MAIRVLLFEDNYPLREALSYLIDNTDGFTLIGAFGDCLKAVEHVETLRPDVVLMDIDLPGMNGIQALVNIRKKHPTSDVLMLTVFDDEHVFEAIKAGAVGYLLKKTPPAQLIEAIRQVAEGGAPMSPSIARKVLQSFARQPTPETELTLLSDRERQVLDELAKGGGYKSVANELNLSVETIRTYAKRIYQKLQVHSVVEAVNKLR